MVPNATRQPDQARKNSAINGMGKNARFGASSCTEIALPQWRLSTSEVMVAIAEGIYRPAEKPTPKSPQRIIDRFCADAIDNIAMPTPAPEMTIAHRCDARAASSPDESNP